MRKLRENNGWFRLQNIQLKKAIEQDELIEVMMNESILTTIHETAKGLHKAGIMKLETMREFDVLCIPPVKEYSPGQIKQLRLKNGAGQAVFAAYLNTTVSTIQKWEQGKKKPSGLSLKFLNIVDNKGIEILV